MNAEPSSRLRKSFTVAALTSAAGLLAALVVALTWPIRIGRVTDDRLLGTWQSDADRTIAGIRELKPVDDEQEISLRKLFGKLRVTYKRTTYMIELDGRTDSKDYEVLGKDRNSVVLREVGRKASPLDDDLKLSEFTVIHLDGADSYWLYTEIGGIQEYFKRVR